MNNPTGFGVFGTFGDPYGYQQLFYNGANFSDTLDLDDHEIELYAGHELYAVKRILHEGVYTICCCIYSPVKELHTARVSTFVGSCIVLIDGYAEAEYVYKVLHAIQEDIISNDDNIYENVLKAIQVQDIVVKEPFDFVPLRANVIPISKTPFFTSFVDPRKKTLVLPEQGADQDAQIILFFEEALKHYTDTGTLYFSFDPKVAEFVRDAGEIETMSWQEYAQHATRQPTPVVRTKKGIQKVGSSDIALEPGRYILASSEVPADVIREANNTTAMPPSMSAPSMDDDFDDDEEDVAFDENDNRRPFDVWDETIPLRGWSRSEARYRVKEYNRLFRYTATLLEHMNSNTTRGGWGAKGTSKPGQGNANRGLSPNQRVLIVLATVALLVSTGLYLLLREPVAQEMTAVMPQQELPTDTITTEANSVVVQPPSKPAVTITDPAAPTEAEPVEPEPEKPVAKAPIGPPTYEEAEQQSPAAPATTEPAKTTAVAPVKVQPEAAKEPAPIDPALVQKAGELHPYPNFEMAQNDIVVLRQNGVKNKTLTEIARMLFDNVPSNIGNIYKGQETEYAAALLNTNKQSFQRSGSDYICTSDNNALHIPAYRSPRMPVIQPK